MLRQCQGCSRISPEEAVYCYFDGTPLRAGLQHGPMRVGSQPFPTILYFSDGTACSNFNQLAITCNNHWEEAKSLLVDGIWPTFFAGMGRLDLAAAAKQAAKEPDLDRGLSSFLVKLPADPEFLRPPRAALESPEQNLGQLSPGQDHKFEVVVVNQGMMLLYGTVSIGCDWLIFDNRSGPLQKVFQTRDFFSTRVMVLGNKLRAGQHAMEGEILIDTNGGAMSMKVRAEVPIRPFPKGVYVNDALAGAKSPREIAIKAKEHPNEAAALFEQGAVKAWYESNGWKYPVEGTQGSGKGAVQQFFEALGLAKPPKLDINTVAFVLKGKIGERLSRSITVSTEEAKPVFANASSNRDWVVIGSSKYQGNKVKIPVDVVVPPQPGVTMHAQVYIQGNGNQQFLVPVSVEVADAPMVTEVVPGQVALVSPDAITVVDERRPTWWEEWVEWFNSLFGKSR